MSEASQFKQFCTVTPQKYPDQDYYVHPKQVNELRARITTLLAVIEQCEQALELSIQTIHGIEANNAQHEALAAIKKVKESK